MNRMALAFRRCIVYIFTLLFPFIASAQDTGYVQSFVNTNKSLDASNKIKTSHHSLLFPLQVLSPATEMWVSDRISVPAFAPAFKDNINSGFPLVSGNKKRVRLVTAANIIGYGGTMAALYTTWYSNYPQTNFHVFNDNREWKQVDKIGHAYSAYIETYGSSEMWKWAGLSQRKAVWVGGVSSLAYQTMIETLDAFSAQWGWSWGDMASNIFGSGLLVGQELAWRDQRIKFKFSFHRKNYDAADLNARTDKLFGSSLPERMLKDYNGQTYWWSANVKSFLPKSNVPSWLSIAFGYGADNMFGAEVNVGKDNNGNINFDRRDLKQYRQYYLAPDVDLTKIKTRNKVVRFTLGVLNAFKFPMPSVELNSKGKFLFHVLHF